MQEFDLPCPPLEFWSRFLANHSNWLHKFHASRGDSSIRVSKWQRHFKARRAAAAAACTACQAALGWRQHVATWLLQRRAC